LSNINRGHCTYSFEGIEDEECPRFSLDEFKASIFDPVFHSSAKLLSASVAEGADGLSTLMDGLRDKSKKFDVNVMKQAITYASKTFEPLLAKAVMSLDSKWERVLQRDLRNPDVLISSLDDLIMEMNMVRKSLSVQLEQLIQAAKGLVDPMAKLMEAFLAKTQADDPEKLTKLMSTLEEKNKIWGLVIGKLVMANKRSSEIPQADIFVESGQILTDLRNAIAEGDEEEEGYESDDDSDDEREGGYDSDDETEIDWRKILEDKLRSKAERCEQSDGPCWRQRMADLLTSMVAYTESADNSWIPSLEEMKMQYDKLKLNKGI